jgi:hypothetical protein
MANFELRFRDMLYPSDYIKAEKSNYKSWEEDYILISFKLEENEEEQQIMLDKSTAIKFAKTLRTEINKITESEGNLG